MLVVITAVCVASSAAIYLGATRDVFTSQGAGTQPVSRRAPPAARDRTLPSNTSLALGTEDEIRRSLDQVRRQRARFDTALADLERTQAQIENGSYSSEGRERLTARRAKLLEERDRCDADVARLEALLAAPKAGTERVPSTDER